MKVYVACSSNELIRAEGAIALLRDMGIEVAYDWPAEVRATRRANGLGAYEALAVRETVRRAIQQSSVVWALLPDGASAGVWWECGFAEALGKRVIYSGGSTTSRESVFVSSWIPNDIQAALVVAKAVRPCNGDWFAVAAAVAAEAAERAAAAEKAAAEKAAAEKDGT